jgi:hypothetical protein
MAFTGHENHKITLEQGQALTKEFRRRFGNQPNGYYFSKDIFNSILEQTGCVGIRFYFASDMDGVLKLVFVGVDQQEDDLLAIVGDSGSLCPPACGGSNVLNS